MTNPFALAANLLNPPDNNDPAVWVENRLGGHLWSKQREVADSVRDNKRTVVASAHGEGKSQLAAWLVGWWLDSHQPGQAFVLTTAPTFHQVRAILWRYINQMHARAKLRGRVNQTEWHMGGELVAIGRKPADHNESAMQGIHAPKVLIIFDEAGGIPAQLWLAAEAIAVNDDCRILAIGNPDFPQGSFRDAWDSPMWHRVRISALDNPNFTGEECPVAVKSQLASVEWVNDMRSKWGESSPIYQSKVLGMFPSSAENSVIDYAKMVAASQIELENDPESDVTILGVDVAGGGTDMTVVRERRGSKAIRQWTTGTQNADRLIEWLHEIIVETQARAVRIDSTGVGWAIVGALRQKCPDILIAGVNAAAQASQPQRFLNARAEMWWNGRMKLEAGEIDLTEAQDFHSLLAEMTAPKWSLNERGRIKLESKDEVRDRIGRSPDHADALLLAFYDRLGHVTNEELIKPSAMKIGGSGPGALATAAKPQGPTGLMIEAEEQPDIVGISRNRIGGGRWR